LAQPGEQAQVRIIPIAGHVRMGDVVDRMRSAIDASLSAGEIRIVMDMTGVKSFDSSAIGVLVRGLSLAKQRGGVIKLAAVPENAKHSLQLTGILRLFEVYPTQAEAVSAFST
jgi:anti-anti-sigma factor